MTQKSPESGLPNVAIAGATGYLGQHITSTLLSSPVRPLFSKVILLSRKPASSNENLSKWQNEAEATIRSYNEDNLAASLADVDVLINTIGSTGHDFKEKLLRAIPDSKVTVYFPSEFGVDHTIHDFPHAEWDKKKAHSELAKKLIPDVKTCRVYCGLFLEDSIGPWFGFDTRSGKYESVGSAQTPISFTSLDDVGKIVARLAVSSKEKIPDYVHVGGDTVSISEIASVMMEAGAGEIDITEIDLKSYKERTIEEGTTDPSKYLRFLMGEGKINHSSDDISSDNDLINPREENWRWKKMTDLARETGGKPWADYEWPPK